MLDQKHLKTQTNIAFRYRSLPPFTGRSASLSSLPRPRRSLPDLWISLLKEAKDECLGAKKVNSVNGWGDGWFTWVNGER